MARGLRAWLLAGALLLLLPASAAAFGPLGNFGPFGKGAGELWGPQRGSVAGDGSLFVIESDGNRVSVFSGGGSFLRAFGKGVNSGPGDPDICTVLCQESADGDSAGALNDPEDSAVAPVGRVYVSERGNNRVSVFSAAGDFEFAFGKEVGLGGQSICTDVTGCKAGETGETDSGAFSMPAGLTADSARVYVAETENNRVSVFDLDGDFEFAFGKGVNAGVGDPDVCTTQCKQGESSVAAGSIGAPEDVAIGPEGNIFVVDGGDTRVAVFSAGGEFITMFGETGPEALVGPGAIAFDAAGSLWVADTFGDRVKRFSAGGSFLGGFAAAPRPTGVIPACGGNLFVVSEDVGDQFSRVERYGEPGAPAPPCPEPPAAEPVKVSLIPFIAPSNRVRFNRLQLNRGNGSAVLFVRVAGPGQVILKGRGVRRLSRGAPRAKVVRLPIKPKVRLRSFVKRHGKGRIRVEVTFRPVGGEQRTIEKVIVLRRKR